MAAGSSPPTSTTRAPTRVSNRCPSASMPRARSPSAGSHDGKSTTAALCTNTPPMLRATDSGEAPAPPPTTARPAPLSRRSHRHDHGQGDQRHLHQRQQQPGGEHLGRHHLPPRQRHRSQQIQLRQIQAQIRAEGHRSEQRERGREWSGRRPPSPGAPPAPPAGEKTATPMGTASPSSARMNSMSGPPILRAAMRFFHSSATSGRPRDAQAEEGLAQDDVAHPCHPLARLLRGPLLGPHHHRLFERDDHHRHPDVVGREQPQRRAAGRAGSPPPHSPGQAPPAPGLAIGRAGAAAPPAWRAATRAPTPCPVVPWAAGGAWSARYTATPSAGEQQPEHRPSDRRAPPPEPRQPGAHEGGRGDVQVHGDQGQARRPGRTAPDEGSPPGR